MRLSAKTWLWHCFSNANWTVSRKVTFSFGFVWGMFLKDFVLLWADHFWITIDHYWTTIDHYWTTVEPQLNHYWPLLTTSEPLLNHYWTTIDHYWPLLTTIDHYWPLLTTTDHYWPLLNHYWANVGQYWTTIGPLLTTIEWRNVNSFSRIGLQYRVFNLWMDGMKGHVRQAP